MNLIIAYPLIGIALTFLLKGLYKGLTIGIREFIGMVILWPIIICSILIYILLWIPCEGMASILAQIEIKRRERDANNKY